MLRGCGFVALTHCFSPSLASLPQTWEDPNEVDRRTGCKGDNDPIDALEVSAGAEYRLAPGQCVPVAVLGALGMIDEGETDWKVLTMRLDNPMLELLATADGGHELEHIAHVVREWFRVYKVPDGKGEASFADDERLLPSAQARGVILEAHESWQRLLTGKTNAEGLWIGD